MLWKVITLYVSLWFKYLNVNFYIIAKWLAQIYTHKFRFTLATLNTLDNLAIFYKNTLFKIQIFCKYTLHNSQKNKETNSLINLKLFELKIIF